MTLCNRKWWAISHTSVGVVQAIQKQLQQQWGRVAHPSFFEGWDSTDASIMGFRACTTQLDAQISPWGTPIPTFVAGTTHLKLPASKVPQRSACCPTPIAEE